ncbi:creatininase family protein [Bryobacter aggregatus]|uniref:creatininase family protein n=1 Tax=Bryobacter aggregatus TaxID=360054 RepID=UPI0004E0D183|nr:creatininase family protein [Bryobacter aggregatus]
MLLENATWPEVAALPRNTIVVAPFGAMEQHGPHLPFQTDARIATELVQRLDQAVDGSALILPVQWAGYSPHHMDFAGSITLTAETYIRVAVEIASSLAHAGFHRFLLLNAHGGNRAILDVAATELRFQFPQASFVTATYWNVARAEIQGLRESSEGGMGHACELETSILLAISKHNVRLELAQPDGAWPCSDFLAHDMLGSSQIGIASAFSEFTKSGTNGDPRTATAAKGEQFLNAITGRLALLLRQYQSGELLLTKSVR